MRKDILLTFLIGLLCLSLVFLVMVVFFLEVMEIRNEIEQLKQPEAVEIEEALEPDVADTPIDSKSKMICPDELEPVVGIDGEVYGNPCYAEREGTKVSRGATREEYEKAMLSNGRQQGEPPELVKEESKKEPSDFKKAVQNIDIRVVDQWRRQKFSFYTFEDYKDWLENETDVFEKERWRELGFEEVKHFHWFLATL